MHPSCFMLSFWLSWMPPCNAQCSQRKMVFKLKIEEHVEPSTTDYFFCIMVFSPPLCCLSINQVASLLVSLTPPASKDTFCLFRVFTCAPETNYWVTCCNFPKKWNARKYCFYMPKSFFFRENTIQEYNSSTPEACREYEKPHSWKKSLPASRVATSQLKEPRVMLGEIFSTSEVFHTPTSLRCWGVVFLYSDSKTK